MDMPPYELAATDRFSESNKDMPVCLVFERMHHVKAQTIEAVSARS
jgi:hypothetical protein